MQKITIVALLIVLVAACGSDDHDNALCSDPEVTDYPELTVGELGTVRGLSSAKQIPHCPDMPKLPECAPPVYRYLNLPFADVGSRRWEASTVVRSWGDRDSGLSSTPLDGTDFGPFCAQPKAKLKTDTNPCFEHTGKEECLNLNVFTPVAPNTNGNGGSGAAGAGLPVIVWIPGGNFFAGSSNICLYDGTRIASTEEVVVVTINYRVGALGFLGNFDDAKSGNFGLGDQQRALEWVRENIEYFGGDPENVTIWGESSGASSVAVHLASPESQKLFQKAISESAHLGMMFADKQTANRRATKLAEAAAKPPSVDPNNCPADGCGCDEADLDCLRSCPLEILLRLSTAGSPLDKIEHIGCQGFGGFQQWSPMIEDETTTPLPEQRIVTHQPMDIGAFTSPDIPVMIGTNVNEGVGMFVAIKAWDNVLGDILGLAYPLMLDAVYGEEKALAIMQVPGLGWEWLNGLAGEEKFAEVVTRDVFSCPAERVLRARQSAHPESQSYAYSYGVTYPSFNVWNAYQPAATSAALSCKGEEVCHGNELPFVWGNPADNFGKPNAFTPIERQFSDRMVSHWMQFARTGNPNIDGNSTQWVPFESPEPGFGSYMGLRGNYAGMRANLAEEPEPFFEMIDSLSKSCGLWETEPALAWGYPPAHTEPACTSRLDSYPEE